MKPFHDGLAVISVTEGVDKPVKHPTTFNRADVARSPS
jgi:Ni2+-binding GTPase involved in maturation of urease and hydrogenase